MEGKLPNNEQYFHAFVTATSDVVYKMSADWSIMYHLESSGFVSDTDAPVSDWMEKYIFSDDLPMAKIAIENAIANKTIFNLEHRVLQADGSIGWTFSRAVPILDSDGTIKEWFGAANDITSKKRLEEELDRQKRLYEAVTSGTPDLVYVFALDYTFTYANQALLSMWGRTAEKAIGKSLLENGYEPWHADMHEREIDHIVATGDPVRGEVSFPHAVLGERVYDYILTPVFNEFGKVEAVAGITRDVTDRRSQDLKNMELSEEMAAVNEELASSNEELNATNEELQLSQNRLSQSNSNLQQILNMLPASVVVIRGDDLVVEMINTSNLEYWKKSIDQVVGKPFLEILPDLADQPFAGQLRRVMATGETIDVKESPVLFTAEDGTIRETFVDYTYQALSDWNGNRNGVLVMSFEITDRVHSRRLLEKYATDLSSLNDQLSITNNQLVKSEQRFKYLIQEAPVAIGVLHGEELIVESANAKILEVWGKTTAIIGQPLHIALPELQGQPFLGILADVYTSGKPFFANEIRAMLEHNGKMKEIFFNVVYQPVFNNTGSTADILVVAVDVTQQVNSRKQVEQAELGMRLAIEAANVGTWHIHSITRKLTASPRLKQLFGFYPDEEITIEDAIAQVTTDYRDYVAKAIENAISGNGNFDISYSVLGARDKKLRWVRALGNLSMDISKEFSAFTGVIMDITDQKEDELRKNDFIGMVSHELKTPLTSLNGYLQVVQRKAKKEEDDFYLHAFDQSLKQVRQMTTMINGFLNVSRFDSGKIHIEKAPFNLTELFEEIAEEQQSLLGSHQLAFGPLEKLVVNADRAKIAQVLNNLISNAAKYSQGDTVINVSCAVEGQMLRIGVADQGIGIREQDLEKLFERYYRAENGGNISGFGIGLYLSAEIINRHQGKIWVESQLGIGSTFYFELPLK